IPTGGSTTSYLFTSEIGRRSKPKQACKGSFRNYVSSEFSGTVTRVAPKKSVVRTMILVMNKKAISCALGILIFVSACSSNEGELNPDGAAASTSETPVAETAAPEPDPELIEASDAEEEETTDAEPEQSEPARSVRGNLIKEIGEEGGVGDASGDLLIAFTVSEVESDFECTADFAEKPENGKFVGLKFEVTTDASLSQEPESTFWLSSFDFSVWDDDGKRVNDRVGYSYECV